MKISKSQKYSLSHQLCFALVLMLLFNLFAIPVLANSELVETSGEVSDEITEEHFDDSSIFEDESTFIPPLDSNFIVDTEIEDNIVIGGENGEIVSPNAIPTNPFSNDIISIAATDIMLESGETHNVRCLIKDHQYTLDFFYEGSHLFTYNYEGSFITLTGVHPGDSVLMVYYSKRNGNEVLDEGHVFLNIRVQPRAGYALIKNVDCKRYIDVPGSKTADGTKPVLWSRNQTLSQNQIWRIIPLDDGTAGYNLCTVQLWLK